MPRGDVEVFDEFTPKLHDSTYGSAVGFDPALAIGLETAVPLWIAKLSPLTFEQRTRDRREAASLIATRGDALQFGARKSGTVAKVFNRLAYGLALLAYQPGGVTFAGLHFEADPEPPSPPRISPADAARLDEILADLRDLCK